MAVRTRMLSALTAGGVLAGSLLLGAGAAQAAPAGPYGGGTVPATCGQTVTAYPGDTIRVTPKVGVPFVQTARPGMAPVAMRIAGLLCSVPVNVLMPVSSRTTGPLTRMAPPLGTVTTRLSEESGKVLTPKSKQATPLAPLQPTPRAAAPAPRATLVPLGAPIPTQAPMAAMTPQQLAANAPLFAPAFSSELPSSFLSGAAPAPGLSAGMRSYDAATLFGSAFPGLSAGAPALGYDPASAVTTASQVQALPVDGLSDGLGIPAVLAVLALSGVAAFVVRRMVLGRALPVLAGAGSGSSVGAAAMPMAAAPVEAEPVEEPEVTEVTETTRVPALAAEETTDAAGAPLDSAEVTGVIPPADEDAPETTGVFESAAESTTQIAPVTGGPTAEETSQLVGTARA